MSFAGWGETTRLKEGLWLRGTWLFMLDAILFQQWPRGENENSVTITVADWMESETDVGHWPFPVQASGSASWGQPKTVKTHHPEILPFAPPWLPPFCPSEVAYLAPLPYLCTHKSDNTPTSYLSPNEDPKPL